MATPSWLTQNRNRAFPFLRGTVNLPVTGPLTLLHLPNAVVVDAGFVIGSRAQFDPLEHTVYLNSISRLAGVFTFEFLSDAPELAGVPLIFTRTVGDADNTTQFSDSGESGLSDSSLSDSTGTCDESLWNGYLVTGRLSELELFLPVDGAVGRGIDSTEIEPALIQSLAGTYVTKIGLANDDRTRLEADDDCPEIGYQFQPGTVHIAAPCLRGVVQLIPGFNSAVRQSRAENSLVLGAVVGGGAGQPCQPIPLFDGEVPPAGSNLLDGGPACSEVLRSLNGQAGPTLNFIPGRGVTVTADPLNFTVRIAIDMTGLAVCASASSISESC